MPRDEFWDALKEHAHRNHQERVAKNPDRIAFAIQQFEAHGIEYQLKNPQTGHFHCWRKSDDKLFQFYAGTGKIQGLEVRGIHPFINILTNTGEPKVSRGDFWIAEISFFNGNPVSNYIIHVDSVTKDQIGFTPFVAEDHTHHFSNTVHHFKLLKKVMDWKGCFDGR